MPKIKVSILSLVVSFFLTVFVVHNLSVYRCINNERKFLNKHKIRLIILILSKLDNIEQRNTIRKTWLQNQSNIKNFFVIGTVNFSPKQMQIAESENEQYDDLLLLPKLVDAYGTLTKKVLQSIVYVHEYYDFDFLLKTDDDSYVTVDQILRDLTMWENKGTKKELYWGYFNGRARVKRSGPWKETDWFLCDYYLPYALGGGYILSYNLVKFIAQNADYLKLHNSEDISVGLWLASVANIDRKHDIRFDTEYRSRGCSNKYVVTHKQSIQDMKKMYEVYTETGNLCVQEVSNYLGYQYNWTVPPSQCCDRRPGIL